MSTATGSATFGVEAALIQPEDHVTNALNRLPIQFVDQPNVIAALTCLVTPMQLLENTIAQIILQRSVNIATGVTLTMIGNLVGQSRNGITDDEIFRRFVRARIAVNKSNGLPNTLIRIARLVLNDSGYSVTLRNEGTATARMTIGNEALTDTIGTVLATMLESAVAAGVRLVVEWSNEIPANTFSFDSGPGFDQGHLASALDNEVVL